MTKRKSHTPVTIETVADTAGVSTMTVSRVLRGTGNVSTRTRARVESAMDELGYVHNRLAGALAAAHGSQIAVIVPTLKSIVFTELLAGITDALEGIDYQPVIAITEYDQQKEWEMVKSMMGWRPAGLILANIYHVPELVSMLANSTTPVVEVMELTRKPVDMCVGLDHWAAGKAMALHLIDRGYRNIGYLGTDLQTDRSAGRRLKGFKTALAKAGIGDIAELTVRESSGITLGRTQMGTLLERHPQLDAVYFSNDAVATGAMMHCMAHGISVPQQLALASFSGLEIGQALPVPLTTVRSPRYEIGKLAVERIKTRLADRTTPKVTNAGFELITGAST
jgi:LacI family gluconate utilization system Gnt-I transcriptional repressor